MPFVSMLDGCFHGLSLPLLGNTMSRATVSQIPSLFPCLQGCSYEITQNGYFWLIYSLSQMPPVVFPQIVVIFTTENSMWRDEFCNVCSRDVMQSPKPILISSQASFKISGPLTLCLGVSLHFEKWLVTLKMFLFVCVLCFDIYCMEIKRRFKIVNLF